MLIPTRQCQDFQIVVTKMCRIRNHNNVAQKLRKMKNIHRNKIYLKKNIYLNKQFKVCRD